MSRIVLLLVRADVLDSFESRFVVARYAILPKNSHKVKIMTGAMAV